MKALALAGLLLSGLLFIAFAMIQASTKAIDDAFDGLGNMNGSPSHNEEIRGE
jgi:hypothetical protein